MSNETENKTPTDTLNVPAPVASKEPMTFTQSAFNLLNHANMTVEKSAIGFTACSLANSLVTNVATHFINGTGAMAATLGGGLTFCTMVFGVNFVFKSVLGAKNAGLDTLKNAKDGVKNAGQAVVEKVKAFGRSK